jgi:sugar transferase EpsL
MIKRAFDLVISGSLLLLLAPLLLLVALLILAGMGRPVLFSQLRPGLDGRPFKILKFRTMSDRRGPDGEMLPDAMRLGRLGRMLRASSLDELPELLNVLRGEMSLVGPRPLLMEYLPLYSPEQARRHDVRPGLTGLAQVKGRNALTWADKFALDLWYVEHYSLWLDLKILWWTVIAVVRRDGIDEDGGVGQSVFKGNS